MSAPKLPLFVAAWMAVGAGAAFAAEGKRSSNGSGEDRARIVAGTRTAAAADLESIRQAGLRTFEHRIAGTE